MPKQDTPKQDKPDNPDLCDNVEARQYAEVLFSQLMDEVLALNLAPKALRRIYEVIYKDLGELLSEGHPVSPTTTLQSRAGPIPMSDAKCSLFGRKLMTFGKYKGEQIMNVPPDYLLWISEDEFKSDLQRYLANPKVMNEQEEPD